MRVTIAQCKVCRAVLLESWGGERRRENGTHGCAVCTSASYSLHIMGEEPAEIASQLLIYDMEHFATVEPDVVPLTESKAELMAGERRLRDKLN